MAEGESLGKLFLSFLELVLLVVDDTDLVVDHWVAVVDSSRLVERHQSSLKAVEFEIFHADVERCLVTAWEQTISRPISIHRLVSFIKRSKCMTKGNPAWSEMLVQSICLLEILPRQVILLYQEVVRALTGEKQNH